MSIVCSKLHFKIMLLLKAHLKASLVKAESIFSLWVGRLIYPKGERRVNSGLLRLPVQGRGRAKMKDDQSVSPEG